MTWFNEYRNTDMNAINSYSTPRNGWVIWRFMKNEEFNTKNTHKSFFYRKQNGHFTQIVRDESDRIGCAISKFQSNGFYQSYLVCNYAVTNILNEPIYRAGPTASDCKSGQHQSYRGLCGTNEMYNWHVEYMALAYDSIAFSRLWCFSLLNYFCFLFSELGFCDFLSFLSKFLINYYYCHRMIHDFL